MVRLGVDVSVEMLCLGVKVHLGEQVLRPGGAEYDQEGSRARLGVETFA